MASEYLLGLDIGSSSVKASLIRVDSGKLAAAAQSPSEEMPMLAVKPGWAEQDPDLWWEHAVKAVRTALASSGARPSDVRAIGISYQMHGLVAVGKDGRPLRPSIIWCDSRAVPFGEQAFQKLGSAFCLKHYLNSPGNFTAAKLKWVKENEPEVFAKIYKIMLPGDYIAFRMTGDTVTTATGLSEGIFWDYEQNGIAQDLLTEFGFGDEIIPSISPVFAVQGKLRQASANELGLSVNTPVSYRAGDQPNNAFSLNVREPGETAATAGTSGVIYSVTERNAFDPASRVNTFIHVTNRLEARRNGVLLCVNGTGILNSWMRRSIQSGKLLSYDEINQIASKAPVGSDGLTILPFGNGAERVLENRSPEASIHGLNFNQHDQSHLLRAGQEGIVFALKYGFEVLQEMGVATHVIRAGKANMFLSPLFREAFVNTIGVNLELYNTDGAAGAALGAGIGAGIYTSPADAFAGLTQLELIAPQAHLQAAYAIAYDRWKKTLKELVLKSEITN